MLFSLLKDIFFRRRPAEGTGPTKAGTPFNAGDEAPESQPRKVLNVGGNSKSIPIPQQYSGWSHLLLDIDPRGNPDVLCDARKLTELSHGEFDAIYCSHNLEHYYQHDAKKVLAGFLHVLKDDGFAQIKVPDMAAVMRQVIGDELDIEDVLYVSPSGPIHVIDVIYGWRLEIERSGNDFYAHKTGFTEASLKKHLNDAGFSYVYMTTGNLEIGALAFKNKPSCYAIDLWGLPAE